MSDLLVIASVVLFGCLIAMSAAMLRSRERLQYWSISGAWIAAIAVAFALGGRGFQRSDVVAAVVLLGALPVLVAFGVARLTKSGLWVSTTLTAASWLVTLYVCLTIGLTTGLVRK
jgi:hypothetical protein